MKMMCDNEFIKVIKMTGLALSIMVGATFFSGCSKDTYPDNDSIVTENDEGAYTNDTVVFVVDSTNITVGEVMWYVHFIEEQLSADAKEYMEKNGTSYYDAKANDDGDTVRDAVRKEIVDMVYYYEILYRMAVDMDKYNIDDKSSYEERAKEYMDSLSDETVKKYGLEQEDYENILVKWTLADQYRSDVIQLYEVDRKDLMEQTYTEKEIEGFNEDEYESKADELEENYRQQTFQTEFNNIESNHEIKVLKDIWEAIPIGE